jgi:hypothetical protein
VDSLKLMQSVVSGHVGALKWFGTSASITAVVSEYVRVLDWCGTMEMGCEPSIEMFEVV